MSRSSIDRSYRRRSLPRARSLENVSRSSPKRVASRGRITLVSNKKEAADERTSQERSFFGERDFGRIRRENGSFLLDQAIERIIDVELRRRGSSLFEVSLPEENTENEGMTLGVSDGVQAKN